MQIVRLQKDINEESQRAVSNLRRPPSYTVYPASPLPVYKPFTGLALATGGRGAEGRGRGRGAEGRGRRGVHYREGECMGTADNLPIRARRGTGKAGNPGRTARHVPGPLLSHLPPLPLLFPPLAHPHQSSRVCGGDKQEERRLTTKSTGQHVRVDTGGRALARSHVRFHLLALSTWLTKR